MKFFHLLNSTQKFLENFGNLLKNTEICDKIFIRIIQDLKNFTRFFKNFSENLAKFE
ncbi:hypothetical protein RhiirC2_801778 [Rhizophagus irregularis]|uniref:Uncharacterized protein n=1 Tax=Rhizophagus irregularis TaxID=588596 RepID=A0A2N1M247_9GLOM|nr:hypothetical protein RhiirC2_801778 [Rhizophagus irregularis]